MQRFFAERPSQYLTLALLTLARLSHGDPDPEAVHTVRTTLRRLQAAFELEGDQVHAAVAARCASRFSKLRALQVFHAYLVHHGAPNSDLAIVQDAIHETWCDLAERQACRRVERRLCRIPLRTPRVNADVLRKRAAALFQAHADELESLLDAVAKKPRRKRIHALRLKLKTIRYQEEHLLGRRGIRSHFLKRLREVLGRLGTYEELAEFRKLAKRLRLESRPAIIKEWRRASKRTRSLLSELDWIAKSLRSRKPSLAAGKPSTQVAV